MALTDPGAALAAEIATIGLAGRDAADEVAIGATLRAAKGRIALLAAAAETGSGWSTAQATAALSDLADAALDAGLAVLLRKAAEKGEVVGGITPRTSGLALFALGKLGGRELNYSSDIDIVAFFDREAGALSDPVEASKIYSRIVQRLAALMQDRDANGYVFRTDCGCGRIRARRRWRSPSMRRSPTMRAAARTGNVPPG